MKCFLTLDLDHHSAIDYKIRAKAAFQLDSLIYQWNRFLSLHMESQLLQFIGKTRLISGLKQSRPKPAMNFDRGPDDLRCDVDTTHTDTSEKLYSPEWHAPQTKSKKCADSQNETDGGQPAFSIVFSAAFADPSRTLRLKASAGLKQRP
jgi:hypothetical protein